MYKIGQSGGFLGRIIGPLLKPELPLKRNVLKPLAKSVLLLLGIAAALVINLAIHKKTFWSGTWTFNNFEWRNEQCHENSSVSLRIWFIDKRC